MSEPLATYSYLPWVRRGIAAALRPAQGPLTARPLNAALPVTLHVQRHQGGQVHEERAEIDLRLYGPGDVVGIDQSQIRRTEPRHLTRDFEPNYLAAVEFSAPDFPWLMTPAGASAELSLTPWLSLVVVEAGEGVAIRLNPRRPCPTLEIGPPANPASELPDLTESPFWAHVQVAHDTEADGELDQPRLAEILGEHPERVVSRLISPRRLAANRRYLACLTPTFKAGADRGLGLAPTPQDGLNLAWIPGSEPQRIELPVYYHWEFSTGRAGDFESLARMLKARPAPPAVGTRPMDVSRPGFGLADAPGAELALESALRAPGAVSAEWPDEARRTQLGDILNSSTADPDGAPRLTPPIYGQQPARRETVPRPGSPPRWLGGLNLDLRHRAAAGAGAEVVRRHQEPLAQAAWERVGEIVAANQLLKKSALARSVGEKLLANHLGRMDVEAQIQTTAPAHPRILASPVTVLAKLRASRLPVETVSGAFRRVFNRRGPVFRRLGRGREELRPASVLQGFEEGRIPFSPPARPPAGAVTLEDLSDLAPLPRLPSWVARRLRLWILLALVVALLAIVLLAFWVYRAGFSAAQLIPAAVTLGAAALALRLRARRSLDRVREGLSLDALTPAKVRTARPQSGFRAVSADAPFSGRRIRSGTDDGEWRRFIEASARRLESVRRPLDQTPESPRPAFELSGTADLVRARLDPSLTITARVRSRIRIRDREASPADPLEPILAAPEFSQPMYRPLAQLSPQFLLAGVERIPPNTVTLLETNADFVEAYMVGLSHEMARELLWREYPTEQRATFFRQFWDPPPAPRSADPEALKDIPPIHTWQSRSDLGQHLRFQDGSLVLLVRGELIRRYPAAVVAFTRAEWTSENLDEVRREGVHVVGGKYRRPRRDRRTEDLKFPVFSGFLNPDITFLGFDLTAQAARGDVDENGNPRPDGDPGWFLTLREPPAETRFGLDTGGVAPIPDNVEDLAWEHVLPDSNATHLLANRRGLMGRDFNGGAMRWGANSAHMACILLQQPVVVAIHADDMIGALP